MDTAFLGKNVLVQAVGYISIRYAAGASSQAIPISFVFERIHWKNPKPRGPVLNCRLLILQ